MQKLFRGMRVRALRALLAGRCSVPDAIMVTSSPRSGSTWLGQILSAIPGSAALFEPCHLNHVPEARAAGLTLRTYVPPEADWPEGRAYFTRVFEGHVINGWTAQETTLASGLRARFLVVKFVRATRLLPWVCRHLPIRPPVLLIRHPCAVIASQLKGTDIRWHRPGGGGGRDALPPHPDAQRVIDGLTTQEELLAANWALDYLPALTAPGPRPWQLVSYEELVTRTPDTLSRLFGTWGIDVPAGVRKKVLAPSRMTYKSGMSGLDGWRKQLDPGQVRRILDVVARLGLTFYGDAPEPDYDLLHALGPTEKSAAADSPEPSTFPPTRLVPARYEPMATRRAV